MEGLGDPDLRLAVVQTRRPTSPRPAAAPSILPAALLSGAAPHDLKTAILYTEILGKPLALRDRTADLLALH